MKIMYRSWKPAGDQVLLEQIVQFARQKQVRIAHGIDIEILGEPRRYQACDVQRGVLVKIEGKQDSIDALPSPPREAFFLCQEIQTRGTGHDDRVASHLPGIDACFHGAPPFLDKRDLVEHEHGACDVSGLPGFHVRVNCFTEFVKIGKLVTLQETDRIRFNPFFQELVNEKMKRRCLSDLSRPREKMQAKLSLEMCIGQCTNEPRCPFQVPGAPVIEHGIRFVDPPRVSILESHGHYPACHPYLCIGIGDPLYITFHYHWKSFKYNFPILLENIYT